MSSYSPLLRGTRIIFKVYKDPFTMAEYFDCAVTVPFGPDTKYLDYKNSEFRQVKHASKSHIGFFSF